MNYIVQLQAGPLTWKDYYTSTSRADAEKMYREFFAIYGSAGVRLMQQVKL